MQPFGDRLVRAVHDTGPLCVGVDPSTELLDAWGLADSAGGVREFSLRCLDAFAGVVPVLKPQVAFFERHGAAGFEVLEELLGAARDKGVLVIADAKRGDIGNTSAAYADAWLNAQSPLRVDAVTANPYLGLGSLDPLIDLAVHTGRGVIVVVRSSNPEGVALQSAVMADGRSVVDGLLEAIAARNVAECTAGASVGSVGAVIGATGDDGGGAMAAFGGVILAPGVGTQGATPVDVARVFSGCAPGTVLPHVSRSVLAVGPDPARMKAAATGLRDELAGLLL